MYTSEFEQMYKILNKKFKCQPNFRYLETSLIDVDLEPKYVRVTLKGKMFQMALNEEIRTSDVTSQRSQMTGHLLIIMPKLSFDKAIISVTSEMNTKKSGKGNDAFRIFQQKYH